MRKALFLIGLIGILINTNLNAQQLSLFSDSDSSDWAFAISPYALLAAQSTDVEGEKIRQSFNDLASMTNFGFQIIAAARYKRWILSVDGTFANLQSKFESSLITADLSIDQRIIDNKLGYIIYSEADYSKTEEAIRGWNIQATLGAKYWKNDVNVDVSGILDADIKEKQEWTDLMIGVKASIILNKRVLLGVSGDIGGFSLFEKSSKFSSAFTYTNTFRVANFLWVTAGFRSFGYNRTDGDDENEVNTQVNVLGPLLGVSFVL